MLIAKTCIILVFYYSVTAEESQSSTNLPELIAHMNPNKSYRYLGNHPPIFEDFDNAPVDEDEIKLEKVRKRKSLNENEQTKSGLRVLFNKDEIDSTTIKTTKRLTNKYTVSQVETPDLNNATEPNSKSTLRVPKEGRRQRLRNEGKLIERNYKNTSASHNVTENFNSNNDSIVSKNQPRTFPKKPAEFNPVIKKKRRERDPVVKIIQERNDVYSHTGNFYYGYEGGDGTIVNGEGFLKSFADKTAGESVSGSVYYKDKEGNYVSLTYTADENGYQPIGDHLPTSPPIPPQIARALAYLATKSTPQSITESYAYNSY